MEANVPSQETPKKSKAVIFKRTVNGKLLLFTNKEMIVIHKGGACSNRNGEVMIGFSASKLKSAPALTEKFKKEGYKESEVKRLVNKEENKLMETYLHEICDKMLSVGVSGDTVAEILHDLKLSEIKDLC